MSVKKIEEINIFYKKANEFLESSLYLNKLFIKNKEKLTHVETHIYLNSVCFELIIKIYNLIDNENYRKNHDLNSQFDTLNDRTKKFIEGEFNKMKKIQDGTFGILPKYKSPVFLDALEKNKEIITNYKYTDTDVKDNLGGYFTTFLENLLKNIGEKLN